MAIAAEWAEGIVEVEDSRWKTEVPHGKFPLSSLIAEERYSESKITAIFP